MLLKHTRFYELSVAAPAAKANQFSTIRRSCPIMLANIVFNVSINNREAARYLPTISVQLLPVVDETATGDAMVAVTSIPFGFATSHSNTVCNVHRWNICFDGFL